MNCLICGCDITETVKQFGDSKNPMCQSCYLADNSWVYNEPVIVDALSRGMSFEEAVKYCIKEEMTDLQKFAEDFILSFTDPSLPTLEDDAARLAGYQGGEGIV